MRCRASLGVFRASLSRFAGSFARIVFRAVFALRVARWMSRDLRAKQVAADRSVARDELDGSAALTVGERARRSALVSSHTDRSVEALWRRHHGVGAIAASPSGRESADTRPKRARPAPSRLHGMAGNEPYSARNEQRSVAGAALVAGSACRRGKRLSRGKRCRGNIRRTSTFFVAISSPARTTHHALTHSQRYPRNK